MAKNVDSIVSALTKRNRAGNQQPYVPPGNGDESGEYRDNGFGGFHGGSISSKVESKKQDKPELQPESKKEKPALGVEVKDDSGKQPEVQSIKSTYNGQGNKILLDEISARMKRSSNLKFMMDYLKDADDEYSGIIGDFYKENPQLSLKIGKNVRSAYIKQTRFSYFGGESQTTESVCIGQGVFYGEDSYSKGGVFFHESGHALDSSFVDKNGHRGDWSVDYVSEKYGKSMSQMIQEELKQNLGSGRKLEWLMDEIKAKRTRLESELWNESLESEYESLKQQSKNMLDSLTNDPQNKSLIDEQNKLLTSMSEKHSLYSGDPRNIEKREAFINARQQVLDHQKKLSDYQQQFYATKFPNKDAILKRKDELLDKKYNASSIARAKINVIYGDLSDMAQGSLGDSLTGMGHSKSYWSNRTRGNEAFAEIMSAKATNPESYKVLQQFIPQTIGIFDEIMLKIRSRGNKNG